MGRERRYSVENLERLVTGRRFDSWKNQVLDILATELSHGDFSKSTDVTIVSLKSHLEQNFRTIIMVLAKIIKTYLMVRDKPKAIDDIVERIESASDLLIMGGMKERDVEKIQQRFMQAGDKMREQFKRKTIKSTRSWWIHKSALIYELTTSLIEAFQGLSQRRAVRIVAFLLIEFDIEPDKRVRKHKLKISRVDPVFARLEKRLFRFKKSHGTPKTLYSETTKPTSN